MAVVNPIRYRGYYWDAETGFYYLQSRYYDPETKRFVNADGYVFTGQDMQSGNMFAYCGNCPVNYSDTAGTMKNDDMGGGGYASGGCGDLLAALLAYLAAASAAQETASTTPQTWQMSAAARESYLSSIRNKVKSISATLPKDNDDGQIYYHVTTKENAMNIINTGKMYGSSQEAGYVYAWKYYPSKKARKLSGAHTGVVISFRTNASFERDPGIVNPCVLTYGSLQSVFPGPITVWDVQILE